MKKLSTLLILLSLYSSLSAQNPTTDLDNKIDSLIFRLTNKISSTQYFIEKNIYPEFAFLRNEYKLPNLLKNDTPFINNMNDYYYKQFYLFSKLLNTTSSITEDCITNSNENGNISEGNKLYVYALYDNIKLPEDYIEKLESVNQQGINDFWASCFVLKTIYFLKRFNYKQLNIVQKSRIEKLENNLSKKLYNEYINNKPWNFYKVASLATLVMNNNAVANQVDINPLVDYYLSQGQPKTNILDISLVESDLKDSFLMGTIGAVKVKQYQALYTLWIISAKKH